MRLKALKTYRIGNAGPVVKRGAFLPSDLTAAQARDYVARGMAEEVKDEARPSSPSSRSGGAKSSSSSRAGQARKASASKRR